MGTLFNESRETTDGTGIYFKDRLKQEQILLCQIDTFKLYSVQNFFEHDTKPNVSTKVNFSNSTTPYIINAGS